MGLLDNLERGLERVVRSAFSAGGPRAVKPVEIASALRQAMDDESFALSEGHTVAPNSYVVHFSPADFERARSWGSTLASELCDEVIRHADSQGYALPGTVRVAFHPDADVRAAVALPAVAGLTEKTAEPRFPNFKNIMAAKKKPLTVLSLADLGIAAGPAEAAYRSVMVSADTRPERAAGEKITDDGTAAERLVEFLAGRGLV